MAKKGGKRPGAGRPVGSTTKIRVADYFSEEEMKDFWDDLKKRSKTSDKIALYFAEQLTGKASQAVDVTSDGEKIETVVYLPASPKK